MFDVTAIKAYHVLFPLAAAGVSAAANGAGEALYPDTRAFLIYAGYGAMGAAALGIWSTRFRGLWKFLAVLFTGIVLGGTVGSAATDYTGVPSVGGLAAFVSALVGPQFVVDPFGTVKKIGAALHDLAGGIAKLRKSMKHDDKDKPGQ